ncbi:MAG: prepilin-type N-terminal cleavage/methylation domain-containing protein [Armatimonadetes bacterium]|nr:prepilin-type N-terminal cleavage/methylation domain-containing protein [Armatimonadota bacterium]
MANRRRAFTLVELLTVMFITAILMGIIIIPLVQGFNLVRSAQAFADAQDSARLVLDRITAEISNSAGVRDNSGDRGALDLAVPGRDRVTPVVVRLRYTKLDILKPAQEGQRAGGGFVNPNTGKIDPTLKAPKGQIVLPVAPGATIVRYWIGLRDPFRPYNNPYDGLLMDRNGERDNLYVLYRAEVQPVLFQAGGYAANTALFDVDSSGAPILDDPAFFLADGTAAKAQRIRNWLARATVVTEVSRYDMIRPVYDKASRAVAYDGDIPRIVPLIEFRPARVSSEPAEGQSAVRLGEESESIGRIASDVFTTRLGGWSSAIVRLWPNGWTPGGAYNEAFVDPSGSVLWTRTPGGSAPTFDLGVYLAASSAGAKYAFSRALNAAALGDPDIRAAFAPFWVEPESGRVIASFDVRELGSDEGAPFDNAPTKDCGPQETPGTAGTLSGQLSDYGDINSLFNKVWQENPSLRPNIHRFIDLRVTPNADGTPSPLHPDPAIGFPRATIVPGSEVVIGPDQNPGPHYGQPIRYSRTTGEPGPNQYRINYTNLREPDDYGLLGLPNPPATYDPNNLVSAVIQPRYKAGYIQLNSDPNVPLPTGNIRVTYRFQFTAPGDSVTVDYDSRRIVEILLTMRNFPQTAEPNPQSVTLKATATVRNFLR